ncbi:small multi-drug export protein [Candidatus Gracilibacteria bacterium]|nr:small multi-drug export protein [Candidatus Gracilibacteria bacterium]
MFGPVYLTLLWSMTPLLELRASIPLGHLRFGLSIYEATILSILGSVLSAALVLALLPFFVRFFERHIPLFDRIMKRIFAYTHARHSHKLAVLGEIALITFVAVPLPGSGAWTGVLVAYLFGIPYRKAMLLVCTGVVISGIIVALLTLFGHEVWNMIFNEVVEVVAP